MLIIKHKSRATILNCVACLFVIALTACENAPTRREDLLAQHPEWNENTMRVIRSGKIFKGMSKEQVRAAWGRPCYNCQGTTSGTWGESWEYPTQVVFFDAQGKVVRVAVK